SLALGLDHVDFLAAMAPKPVLILAQERDFFDVRGSHNAADRLRHLYQLLGQPEHAALLVGPRPHGYSQENREAMYAWFGRATGAAQGAAEPAITLEEDQTLWCTPQGQVATLDNTRTVFHYTRDKSQQLAGQRGAVQGEPLLQAVR